MSDQDRPSVVQTGRTESMGSEAIRRSIIADWHVDFSDSSVTSSSKHQIPKNQQDFVPQELPLFGIQVWCTYIANFLAHQPAHYMPALWSPLAFSNLFFWLNIDGVHIGFSEMFWRPRSLDARHLPGLLSLRPPVVRRSTWIAWPLAWVVAVFRPDGSSRGSIWWPWGKFGKGNSRGSWDMQRHAETCRDGYGFPPVKVDGGSFEV